MMRTRPSKPEAPLLAILCTPVLGLAACALGIVLATSDAAACLRFCERHSGWIKMIGTVCVLLFLGATLETSRRRSFRSVARSNRNLRPGE